MEKLPWSPAPYLTARTVVARRVRDTMVIAEEPDVVAKEVLKAALAKRPKPRYRAGGLVTRVRLLRAFKPDLMADSGAHREFPL